MLIRVDPSSTRPLYEQLAESIRVAMVSGSLSAGDALPSAKEVAEAVGVNIHTVLRAYQQVRDEGLVDLRRGRGAIVVHHPNPAQAQVAASVAALVDSARRAGMPRADVIRLLEERMP